MPTQAPPSYLQFPWHLQTVRPQKGKWSFKGARCPLSPFLSCLLFQDSSPNIHPQDTNQHPQVGGGGLRSHQIKGVCRGPTGTGPQPCPFLSVTDCACDKSAGPFSSLRCGVESDLSKLRMVTVKCSAAKGQGAWSEMWSWENRMCRIKS